MVYQQVYYFLHLMRGTFTKHTQSYQFPPEWLEVTFAKATFYNSLIAVFAGFLANILSEWLNFWICLHHTYWQFRFWYQLAYLSNVLGLKIMVKTGHASKVCFESLRSIVLNRSIFLIGAVQAMFESVMYIFVFLVDTSLNASGSTIWNCFSLLLCVVYGLVLVCFEYLLKRQIRTTNIICGVLYTG